MAKMRYRIMEVEQRKKPRIVRGKHTQNTAPVERSAGPPLQARLLSAQAGLGNRYVQRMVAQWKNEQGAGEAIQLEPEDTQGEERANRTGLTDQLKLGVEQLSGYSLDDVRVHYNSSKPTELDAFAYTQGTEIYVAQGQERHLPHEAWHVVQQAQGRVKPTMQMKNRININNDVGLEKEADVMGKRALQMNLHQTQGFTAGQSMPAHELTHVVQQGGAPLAAHLMLAIAQAPLIQREEGVKYIPPSNGTNIDTEEKASSESGLVPWMEYGNIYLSVTETGENSWEPIITKRFSSNPSTHFTIFSGTHGEANGYVIDDRGLIDERHQDFTLYEEDERKREAVLAKYHPPLILIIDVINVFADHRLRNPANLKAKVKECSAGDNVAILAWCYSVQALTQAEGEFVRLNNEVKRLYTAFYSSLTKFQQNKFSALRGKNAFDVDSALQNNTLATLQADDRRIIPSMHLSGAQTQELVILLATILQSRQLYVAQKAVPIPAIMAKWA